MGEGTINTPIEIAETFNSHFASVGENLASDITPSTVEPDVYVVPAETTFSMKFLTVYAVYKKLKAINERKATGLDKILCNLLRIAAEILASSLTQIFNKTISTIKHLPYRLEASESYSRSNF